MVKQVTYTPQEMENAQSAATHKIAAGIHLVISFVKQQSSGNVCVSLDEEFAQSIKSGQINTWLNENVVVLFGFHLTHHHRHKTLLVPQL